MSFFDELKKRNVFRVAIAYVVVAWLLLQVSDTLVPALRLPDWFNSAVALLLMLGFPIAVILAWAYELTPDGVRPESQSGDAPARRAPDRRRLDLLIIGGLVAAVAFLVYDKFVIPTPDDRARPTAAASSSPEAALTEPISIAVLPFLDLSPEGDQAYMSDGIAEEILNLLAKIPELRVISRTSSFSFKGKDRDIPTISGKLGTAYILEGSLRKDGDQLRITAQLIDAEADAHLWSDTYDRGIENIFQTQDDIATAVADALKINVLGAAPASRQIDPEAYTMVLRARFFWNRRAEGDERMAREHYERALAIEPDYAPAWAGLSIAYASQGSTGELTRAEALAKSQAAAERSLRLDPSLPDAHVRMAQVYMREGNREAGLRELDRAVALGPSNPLALGAKAYYIARDGRVSEAIDLYRRAIDSDPLSAIWQGNLGSKLLQSGRVEEAEVAVRKAIELGGSHQRQGLAYIHNLKGEFDQALALLETLPANDFVTANLAIAYHGLGRRDESDAAIRTLADRPEEELPSVALHLARAHAARGERDLSFDWLGKVRGLHAHDIDSLRVFKPLHDDARWNALLAELRLREH